MDAEDVVVDHRREGQAVEYRVASFPHLFSELVPEPVLFVPRKRKKKKQDFEVMILI